MGELSKLVERTEGNAELQQEREAHAETQRKLESMSQRYRVSERDRRASSTASTSVLALWEEVKALEEELRRMGEAWELVDAGRTFAEAKAAEAMAETEALRSVIDEAARMAAEAARVTALRKVDKELEEARRQATVARAEAEANAKRVEEEATARAAAEERAREAEARVGAGSAAASSAAPSQRTRRRAAERCGRCGSRAVRKTSCP